jgi:RimJ/RimL family protein N-acetyltransferase
MHKLLLDLPDHFETARLIRQPYQVGKRKWRVAERCGFVREGRLRQTKKYLKRDDGRFSGDYLYGMLQEDFERLNL